VAEHGDLDVLLVGRRPEPEQVEQAADEQEGDLTGHPDDPGRCASPLLRHQILSLHPTGRQDSGAKRHRAAEALTVMEKEGEPISFPAVARRAGVSVSLLYADTTLSSAIATARDRQRQAGPERAWRLPARSLVTEQSLRAELANAKERARRLAEEVAILRERLTRHLGAGADIARGEALSPLLDQLEQRNTELESDNHRQQKRIRQLENDTRELNENLDAARAVNRELISELNRKAPAPAGRSRPPGAVS
jgi:hypothetical protein